MQLGEQLSVGRAYWRGIGAIAGKDIVEALRNKTTLTIVIGLSLMMLTVQVLPLLLGLDSRPRVVIYDAGRTLLADNLREAGVVQVSERRSAEAVIESVRETSGAVIGVIWPETMDAATDPLSVVAYVPHWIRPNTIAEQLATAETALSAQIGRTVAIEVQRVYPTVTSMGHVFMVSIGLVLAVLMITAILVPYLFLEEKTSHTMALLRISPISATQLVAGKAVAGMVYGVVAALVLLAFNVSMVVSWPIWLLAIAMGTLFGVSIGLLAGITSSTEGGIQLWITLATVLLIFPSIIVAFAGDRLPGWVSAVVEWLPSAALFDLLRLSFSNVRPLEPIVSAVGVLLLWTMVCLALVVWRVRRWEA